VSILSITIPGDPIGKGRPRFVRKTGIAFTPKTTRVREKNIAATVREHSPDLKAEADTAYGLGVAFFHATRRRQDIDNLLKLAIDALTGVVWKDDSQVLSVAAWRYYDKANPRTVIEVVKLDRSCIAVPKKGGDTDGVPQDSGAPKGRPKAESVRQEGEVTQ
jgi:Holliday junction resolvase RusA-like endonuclease